MPKTEGSVLQKRLLELEPGLSTISGEWVRYMEQTGVTMKQLLHRNNPWTGAPCHRAASYLSCASDKDIKDNCSKRFILYVVLQLTRLLARTASTTSMLDTAQRVVMYGASVTRRA